MLNFKAGFVRPSSLQFPASCRTMLRFLAVNEDRFLSFFADFFFKYDSRSQIVIKSKLKLYNYTMLLSNATQFWGEIFTNFHFYEIVVFGSLK